MFEEGEGSREEESEMSKDRCGVWEEEEEGRPNLEVEEDLSGEEEGFQEEEEGIEPAANLGPIVEDELVSKLVVEAWQLESGGVCKGGLVDHTSPRGALGKVGCETHLSVSSPETATRVADSCDAPLCVGPAAQVNVGPAAAAALGPTTCDALVGVDLDSVVGGTLVGPSIVVGPFIHEGDLDLEETIYDYPINQETFFSRRGKKKNNKKHRALSLGVPKCFQFAKAVMDGKDG